MKTQWGRWHFNRERLELCLAPGEQSEYPIDLETCTTSEAVLDWIAQVANRNLVTHEDVGQLVRALDELLGLQDALCGGAIDGRAGRTIEPKTVILKRLGQ